MRTGTVILVVALVALALLLLVPVLAMAGMMGGMGMMMLGLLFLLLVLAGVALLVMWAVRRSGGSIGSRPEDPMEILRARYARGEVGREEFERIREDLVRTSSTREELPR